MADRVLTACHRNDAPNLNDPPIWAMFETKKLLARPQGHCRDRPYWHIGES